MINLNNFKHLLVIDLEATCSDDNSFPRDEMEIIEIGAVMVDRATLVPVEDFNRFVRPQRHPVLTEFCTKLTTITQGDVDAALDFPTVMEQLVAWKDKFETPLFCSWGGYDRSQFYKDCAYHDVPYPFGTEHLNIKLKFSETQGRRKRYGMVPALQAAGIPIDGTHHRGIDDARNMVKLLPYITGDKRL